MAKPVSLAQRLDNSVLMERCSGGEPLATLRPIRPSWESNFRPPASIATSLTKMTTGSLPYFDAIKQCLV